MNPKRVAQAKLNLSELTNVQFVNDSSSICLGQCLENLKDERILFYLDAHQWTGSWTIRDELEHIANHYMDNCIILIDDIKVPKTTIPYGRHGDKKHRCSYANLKPYIEKCFSGYNYYYLLTKKRFRGKLLLIPTSYTEEKLTEEFFS